MPQIFHPAFNVLSRASIIGAGVVAASVGAALFLWVRSSYATNIDVTVNQPIPFSHQHHVNDLGIDCRYCHTSVEDSHFAGIPPTKTCMNCHSQIWLGADMLAPVRDSYKNDRSIAWERVHNLADFCYFNHSIHVAKGIGCALCHGRVDHMPLVWQSKSLLMEWCLECHRNPAANVRPREQVFNMNWSASDESKPDGTPHTQESLGKELVEKYDIQSKLSCSNCHR